MYACWGQCTGDLGAWLRAPSGLWKPHPLARIWVWPETLVWIVPRCSESDPNPMDQSADPSPMDQTDKSLDPSPQFKHICMVALHPTTCSPVHCEGGGFRDQSHPVCGKPVLRYWPPLNSWGSTVHILGHSWVEWVAMGTGSLFG